MFENKVLRRIFGPNRDKVTGERGKLRIEELKDLNSSTYIFRVIKSRRIGWAGHIARMEQVEVYTGFRWGNLRERDNWHKREDNIKMYLEEVRSEGMDWIDLAQNRDRWRACVIAVMKLRFP